MFSGSSALLFCTYLHFSELHTKYLTIFRLSNYVCISIQTDDTLSIYLEYVSGGSIHKLLREYGPFKEPVIHNYTGQILAGLAYLHGRNTVHR
jgi:serine/threonine protein kinase